MEISCRSSKFYPSKCWGGKHEVGSEDVKHKSKKLVFTFLFYFYLESFHKEHSTVIKQLIWALTRKKSCLRGFANNTGADQPAHPRSLISAFVIRFLESIICKLATDEILIF